MNLVYSTNRVYILYIVKQLKYFSLLNDGCRNYFQLDLPDVPKIFVNGEHQHERLAGPFDEGKDLNLSCEVAGKVNRTSLLFILVRSVSQKY